MELIGRIFGTMMRWCYALVRNYGTAIFLFTLLTKIVLLPISVWTHFNSIKMIQVQPEINRLKVKYYGQNDVIAEEQAQVFKNAGYRPLLSIIPTVIQLILLVGVAGAIRAGVNDPSINMDFFGIDLSQVPSRTGLSLIWSPLAAGFSSFLLSFAQNRSNVLQSEQSDYNKYGTMALTVLLSCYLGWIVPVGTAFYWVCSNLLAIAQMYLFNRIFPPSKHIDYEELEASRAALAEIQDVGEKEGYFSENRKRELADYKRFFSVVNKHLVFYSEGSGFYKYYRGIIEYILEHTNITIHYVTSDPNDQIFRLAEQEPRIRPYYIGENKLITLMMKMDADVVAMTMTDIETYHIKRSYIRKDIEYVYIQHGIGSMNLTCTKTATDHYDTIFCVGKHQMAEELERERVYGVPKRKLLEIGYPMLDELRAAYDSGEHQKHDKPLILIGPSWQKDNIVDSCLEQILDQLNTGEFDIIVRPHPQEVRHKKQYMENLRQKYEKDGIIVQTDFSSNNPIMEADLLITDWSGISWEFAFTTRRPVLFIDTPMKVMNPDWQQIDVPPLNIALRDQIGKRLSLDELDRTLETARDLLGRSEEYHRNIEALAQEYVYNLGNSSEIAARYIIKTIRQKVEDKKEKQNS